MEIIDKFVVYQGEGPALFPGLTRAANGHLLVSFCTTFDCQNGGQAYLLRSSDDGRTWPEVAVLLKSRNSDGAINLSVGMTRLQDGTILYPCCDARITRKWDQHDADLIILRSKDHGNTWTDGTPVRVGMKEPFAYGGIIELKNGEVLCPIWGKRTSEEAWRSGVVRSRDGGVTWGDYRTIAYDPSAQPVSRPSDPIHSHSNVSSLGEKSQNEPEFHCAGFNETTLLELPDGRVLAILRQHGIDGGQRELYRCISSDQGHSWSSPIRLDVWGTSPSLHLLPNGTIIVGYRNHLGNPQGLLTPGVGVSVSHDSGETWGEHFLLEDPKGYRYLQEFEAGYPAFLTMPDGSIMVVFYSFDPSRKDRYLAGNLLVQQPTATSNN